MLVENLRGGAALSWDVLLNEDSLVVGDSLHFTAALFFVD